MLSLKNSGITLLLVTFALPAYAECSGGFCSDPIPTGPKYNQDIRVDDSMGGGGGGYGSSYGGGSGSGGGGGHIPRVAPTPQTVSAPVPTLPPGTNQYQTNSADPESYNYGYGAGGAKLNPVAPTPQKSSTFQQRIMGSKAAVDEPTTAKSSLMQRVMGSTVQPGNATVSSGTLLSGPRPVTINSKTGAATYGTPRWYVNKQQNGNVKTYSGVKITGEPFRYTCDANRCVNN